MVEKLVEALLSAFPNPAELAYFVRVRLNESLEAVADPGNLKLRVFSLIVGLDAAGEARIRALVLAMRRERANNPKVREALELSAFCWVSALPSPESVQTLVDLLRDQTVSSEDIFASYAVVADDPRRPETIADAVWRIAETSAKTGLPRLVRFVHHVAVRADAGSGRQALLDWIGRYVDQHALDRKQVAAIAEHWNQLEAQREGRHCLLVVLHDEEGDTFRCDAWIGREEATGHDDVMRVAEPIEGVRPEALPGVLAGLLGSSVVVNRVKGDATPILVEVVLPVRAMLTAAEALTSEQSDVWNHHDIVMRWRDRIYARLRETPSVPPYVWEQRWRRRTDPTGRWVPFDQPSGPQKVAARKVFSASSSVALALSFHPNTCPHDRRRALLEEALAQGLPIVAWLADGAPTDADPRVPFEALKNSLPGDALKVFSKARLEWDPLSGDCSRHLVLIWDDPQHLPPDAYEDDLVPPPLVDETLR